MKQKRLIHLTRGDTRRVRVITFTSLFRSLCVRFNERFIVRSFTYSSLLYHNYFILYEGVTSVIVPTLFGEGFIYIQNLSSKFKLTLPLYHFYTHLSSFLFLTGYRPETSCDCKSYDHLRLLNRFP